MGEKGNVVEGIPAAAGAAGAGSSLVGQAGSATANVVLDTGETLRGKLVEGAAEGAVQAGKERLSRRRGPNDADADGPDGPDDITPPPPAKA